VANQGLMSIIDELLAYCKQEIYVLAYHKKGNLYTQFALQSVHLSIPYAYDPHF
jgi:hypothetical protein